MNNPDESEAAADPQQGRCERSSPTCWPFEEETHVDCESCWTWGIPVDALDHEDDDEDEDDCPLCHGGSSYLVTHRGDPGPDWGGGHGEAYSAKHVNTPRNDEDRG